VPPHSHHYAPLPSPAPRSHAKCIEDEHITLFFLQLVEHSLAEFNCPHQKVAIKLYAFTHFTISMYMLWPWPGLCVCLLQWMVRPYSNTSPPNGRALLNIVGPPKHSPRDEALPSTTPPSLAFGRPINL